MRYDETDGSVSVFRQPSATPTATLSTGRAGLSRARHGNRRVTRTEIDGRITVIADNYQGKRLNSPNDVVVKSDDSIWFTDPPYGIFSDYEGKQGRARDRQTTCFASTARPARSEIVADDFIRPNGLAFSGDEKKLYIVDSAGGARERPAQAHPRVRCGRRRQTLRRQGVLPTARRGASTVCVSTPADGFWAATDDGVHCIDADGTLIGKVKIPEICSNVVFGGAKRNYLYITATNSLYGVLLHVNGLRTF